MPPTGDLAHNPGMYPDWELNWRLFGSQTDTQSTDPYQPGLLFIKNFFYPHLRIFFFHWFQRERDRSGGEKEGRERNMVVREMH